jgi:hypothetical protein
LALSARARSSQRVLRQRGVIVTAGCPVVDCSIQATGSLTILNTARTLRLRRVRRSVAADQSLRLKLRLSKKGLRVLRRVLRVRGGRARARATVTVVADDGAGNQSVKRVRIRVRR